MKTKRRQLNKFDVFMTVLMVVAFVVVVAIVVPFAIAQAKTKETLDPSGVYQVEIQPYPMFATNLVVEKDFHKYQYGIYGDIVVDLPVGDSSKLVTVYRFGGCRFSIDFINQEAEPETYYWNHGCPRLKNVAIIIQHVYIQ